MYTIFDIANWFLQKDNIDQRKLQKLCYYSQSWYIALNNRKLFKGDFEAWAQGPMNITLWNDLKSFGYLNIPNKRYIKRTNNICGEVELFLEKIWKTYGKYSWYQLELLSCAENPWIYARAGLKQTSPSNKKIKKDDIKKYYNSLFFSY